MAQPSNRNVDVSGAPPPSRFDTHRQIMSGHGNAGTIAAENGTFGGNTFLDGASTALKRWALVFFKMERK